MKRRVLNILTALSLLLCVSVVVLWVRSYHVGDTYAWLPPARAEAVQSAGARLWYFRAESIDEANFPLPSAGFPPGYQGVRPPPPAHLRSKPNWQYAGFSYTEELPFALRLRSVSIPHWALAAVFSAAPAVALAGILRRRRRAGNGLCPSCGYDLRATPGRCPECGAGAYTNPITGATPAPGP